MTEDFEKVQIGNCQIRLPSSICTEKSIFQNIFSLDTWNQLLDPDQQERVMQMLPTELASTPGARIQAMQDLLSGNLMRFGLSPLESFFRELNVGGFDPEVVKMKTGIKKHWRKDSLRRRKLYHTKLLQEIIIASESQLTQYSDKKASEFLSPNHVNSKTVYPVKKGKSSSSSTKPKKTQKATTAKITPLRQRVAKRLHDEIAAINQAFNYSLTSSDEELPVPKKPSQDTKKSGKGGLVANTPKNLQPKPGSKPGSNSLTRSICPSPVMPALAPVIPEVSFNEPTLLPMASSSNTLRSAVGGGVVKTKEEQAAVKLARLPKIAPSPFTPTTLNRTPTETSSSFSTPALNNKPKAPAPKPVALTSFAPVVQANNPIKSSPILASQLQAPVVSSLTSKINSIDPKIRPSLVMQHDVNRMRAVIPDFPTKVMKLCFKSEDEMESSSEDEFEAIEPTIGFSTNFAMLPTVSKIQHSKSSSRTAIPRSSAIGVNSKLLPAKPKQVLTSIPKVSGAVSSTSTPINKSLQTAHPLAVCSNVNTPNPIVLNSASINVSKPPSAQVISSPRPSLVPIAHSTPVSTTSTANTAKLTANIMLTPSNPVASSTMVPISIQQGFSKVQNIRQPGGLFLANSPTMTIVNGPSSISNTLATCPTPTPNNILPPKSSTPIIANTCVAMPHTHIVPTLNNSQRSSSHLPMSLTDLSLSLGLDVGGDSKLGLDKIDDLSVLDGNPFDSIPNLSDELDGFDLDLVDGLCDFEVLLSEEKQYVSFFSLIREVLCSTQYHRMTLICLEKTIRKWAVTPSAALNPWFMRVNDWNDVLITALNFLAGNYQDVHPEDFVPYIEYKYKTKYYQWIGAGRDSDTNLLQLCNMWLENLDRLPPLKKQDGENEEHEEEDDDNEDSDDHAEEVKKKYMRPKTPPPPRFVTDWTVRSSTSDEKEDFQEQERYRFDNPHKAFTYRMHSYESVVGPVKGVYSSQSGVTNKARGHSLLVDDRPPYVTILALVRDSVARLPNGEGTRSEICEMLRDSAFLAPEASNVTLNSVVSGALDRLHYERDPCVRYDSHKKNWIYLHRDRSQEQFERLHHNRSYTKSTKSRNSSSRKSRKKTISQNSSLGQLSSINSSTQTNSATESSSAIASSSSSVSSTPTSTPTPTLPTLTANLSGTSASAPSLIPSTNKSNSESNLHVGTPKEFSAAKNKSPVNNVLLTTTPVNSSPTIQFTIPASSGTMVNKNWSQESSKSPTFLHIQNLPTSNEAGVSASPGSENSLANVSTTISKPLSSAHNHNITLVTNPPAVLSNSQQSQSTYSSSQFVFGSNALLRLASNLRLPEGVRFTQLRLPVQQNTPGQLQGSQLRFPQHRILLTRGTFPGHSQGQGVLLGQTSTGQTVILSTTAPLGNLHSATGAQINPISIQSHQPQQQPVADIKSSPQFTQNVAPNSTVLGLLNTSMLTSSTNSPISRNTASVLAVSQPQAGAQRTTVTASGSQTPSLTISSTLTTGAYLSQRVGPAPSATALDGVQTDKFQRVQHLGQNIVSVAQVQAQLQQQQQQSSTGSGPAPHLTSPIILRSNQGDFVIPGHISLGRGMQGIKVIPVATGKQTMLARIVGHGQGQTQNPAVQNQTTGSRQ